MANVVVNFSAQVAEQSGQLSQTIGFLPAGASLDVDSGVNLPEGEIRQLSVSITSAQVR